MGMRLNPYLAFNGNAREAMESYQSILGGELSINTFGDFGDPAAPGANQIMHSQLETPAGFTLMGADVPPGMDFQPGRTVTISISGDEDETMRGYWARLSEGATISMELEKQMWGDYFGELTDRFGIAWLINIAGEENRG